MGRRSKAGKSKGSRLLRPSIQPAFLAACASGDVGAAREVLRRGAEVFRGQPEELARATVNAVSHIGNNDSMPALSIVLAKNYTELADFMLSHPLIDVNQCDTKQGPENLTQLTPLHLAILEGNLPALRKIVSNPRLTTINAVDSNNDTPLMRAILDKKPEFVKELVAVEGIDLGTRKFSSKELDMEEMAEAMYRITSGKNDLESLKAKEICDILKEKVELSKVKKYVKDNKDEKKKPLGARPKQHMGTCEAALNNIPTKTKDSKDPFTQWREGLEQSFKNKPGGQKSFDSMVDTMVRMQESIREQVMPGLGQKMGRLETLELVFAGLQSKLDSAEKREEQKKEAGGSMKLCAGCKRKGGKHRCTGCLLEIYCSEECQEAAWAGHEAACGEVRAQFRPVVLHPMKTVKTAVDKLKKEVHGSHIKPEYPKSRFALRVDVDLESGTEFGAKCLWVNNEDRSVCHKLMRIPGQEEIFDQLRRQVPEQGVPLKRGIKIFKAFYYALYRGSTEEGIVSLELNIEKPVAMETW